MSRNRNRRQAKAATPSAVARTGDSFQNFVTRTGVGTPNANNASRYGFSPVSRDRVQLEYAYRSSWIAGQAVDTVAEDMTREGVEIHSDMAPDDLERLEAEASRLSIWDALCDTVKWSRLYGGAVGFLMIDGQAPETPLRMDTIAKGQFKGILALDRWVVVPTLDILVTEFGPEYGKPKYYDLVADSQGVKSMRIHHSRVIRIEGVDLPYWQKIAENGWGQSVLERLWDRLLAFDSATEGAAQLVYKAHLRTLSIDKLREIIAMGGPAMDALVKNVDMIRAYQSNEGLTLIDATDKFEAHQYSFSGLSEMMLQFAQQVSGALQIPMVRLMGQAPAGLGGEHEGELTNYYDGVKQQQERKLRAGVEKVYDVMHRSLFGKEPPQGWEIKFKPLWQMSDEKKANVATSLTTAVVGAFDSQIIDRTTALKELRQVSQITGLFSNISDEQIKEAENDPPPGASEGLPDVKSLDPGQEKEGGESGQDEPGRKTVRRQPD